MKSALKVAAWIVGILIALVWWGTLKDGEHDRVIIVAVVVYVFWSLSKSLDQHKKAVEARLERIEDLLHRQQDTGLTAHEIDGLAEIIRDHRNSKQPASQDG